MKFPWTKTDEVKENVKDLLGIKKKFVKVCTNGKLCRDKDGKRVFYKRADLDKFSQDAFDHGETVFYTELVDPKKPFGAQKLCKPKYEYKLLEPLTEEEYERLFGED